MISRALFGMPIWHAYRTCKKINHENIFEVSVSFGHCHCSLKELICIKWPWLPFVHVLRSKTDSQFLKIVQTDSTTILNIPVRSIVIMSMKIRAGRPTAWDRSSNNNCVF
jgi:hypothetical protein